MDAAKQENKMFKSESEYIESFVRDYKEYPDLYESNITRTVKTELSSLLRMTFRTTGRKPKWFGINDIQRIAKAVSIQAQAIRLGKQD